VIAAHRLQVLAATASSVPAADGSPMAVTVFDVRSRTGELPSDAVIRQQVRRVTDDPAAAEELVARTAARDRERRTDVWRTLAAPPRVLWFDDASQDATVVEVRAHDSAGLLARLARVLTEAGLTVTRARIQTLGAEVVDAFYVAAAGGSPLHEPGRRAELEPLLLAACSTD
jgi:[protein-PII] uridylyltransferase